MSLYALQRRAFDWCGRAFGRHTQTNPIERAKRVLEEAIELAQAIGVPLEEQQHLVAYVNSRPIGDVRQELAGTAVTLLVCAEAHGLDLSFLLIEEIERVEAIPISHFQNKHAAKKAAGVSTSPA